MVARCSSMAATVLLKKGTEHQYEAPSSILDTDINVGPRQFQHMLPATHYISLCSAGIQFPRMDDEFHAFEEYAYKIYRGPNKHCEPMKAEIKARNLTMKGQGNFYFCRDSALAKEIMKKGGERENTIMRRKVSPQKVLGVDPG